jgi:hypothetical protein
MAVKITSQGGGTNAHILVYVSPNDNDWYFCSERDITSGSYAWYDMGQPSCYNYENVLIISYDCISGASSLYVDCMNTGHEP